MPPPMRCSLCGAESKGNNKDFEIACRIHSDVYNYMRDLGTQILICLLLYEYLSSVSTISEATKHRGSLSALSAGSSASETGYSLSVWSRQAPHPTPAEPAARPLIAKAYPELDRGRCSVQGDYSRSTL